MTWVLELSIVGGWLLPTLSALGLIGLLWLAAVRSRRFAAVIVPATAVVSAAVVFAVHVIVDVALELFPEPIPMPVYIWSAVTLFGLLLATIRLIGPQWSGATVSPRSRVVTVVALVMVFVAGAAQINAGFGKYPSIRALIRAVTIDTIDLPAPQGSRAVALDDWTAPSGLPRKGRLATVHIPPTTSEFTSRPAQVYLPPAYFAARRPVLPVIVLVAGQPGSPEDWIISAGILETLDDFAAQHNGVTPIVIAADGTGSELGNPLCMDSRLGNVETYLTTDLADWAAQNLDASTDRKHWAVGGLSYGGTCALQLVTNHPDKYSTFLDMSGQLEPTLGDRERTVDAAFAGDNAAFTAVNPIDLMKKNKYPQVAGVFLVGSQDHEYLSELQRVYDVAKASGMDVSFYTLPGGHSFTVWNAGFRKELPWLAQRIGIGTS